MARHGKDVCDNTDTGITVAKAAAIGTRIGKGIAEIEHYENLAKSVTDRELAIFYRNRAKKARQELGESR